MAVGKETIDEGESYNSRIFVIGILCGYTGLVDIGSFGFDISFVALAMLIFIVGIGIGHNISGLKKICGH